MCRDLKNAVGVLFRMKIFPLARVVCQQSGNRRRVCPLCAHSNNFPPNSLRPPTMHTYSHTPSDGQRTKVGNASGGLRCSYTLWMCDARQRCIVVEIYERHAPVERWCVWMQNCEIARMYINTSASRECAACATRDCEGGVREKDFNIT